MPLSERDQKLLDQIEQYLCAEDPKLAAALGPARAFSAARRLVLPTVAGMSLGMALAMAGLGTKIVILSVLGFLVIVATAVHAMTVIADPQAAGNPSGAARTPNPPGFTGPCG